MRIPKPLHLPIIIAGIAAILFSTLAMTHVPLDWFHGSSTGFDQVSAQDDLSAIPAGSSSAAPTSDGKARVKASCTECGIVDSVRRLALTANAPAVYEITIRMRDGTTRVVSVANHGNWRPRDRVTLIGGESLSAR